MKLFGDETRLRMLMTVRQLGSGTMYRIKERSGMGRPIRQALENLVADKLLNKSQVEVFHRSNGHKHPPSHIVTEYALNRTHRLMPALECLFAELEVNPI